MNSEKKITLIILLLALSSAIFAQKNSLKKDYISTVIKERAVKDHEFIIDEKSPLDSTKKAVFKGLSYFRVNSKWMVKATVIKYADPDTIKMKTTTERLPLYLVYGKAHFTIDGNEFALTIFRNIGLMSKPGYEDYLFIPFRDETSGLNSYGGGRYIDARITEEDTIIIDFNKAYNPYCVYSKKYSCPVPPAENFLNIRVKAGEKDFRH